MAEAVTYADLRFAKGAPNKSRPPCPPAQDSPPPTDGPAAPPADGSDGACELAYENCPPARPRQAQRAPGERAGPGQAGQDRGAAAALRRTPDGPRPRRRVPLLALLGSCLFLAATSLALGLRYWQVSEELQRASQRHAAESGALGERIGSREDELAQSFQKLAQARAELSATRLTLWESWRAGNGTRRQLERERSWARSNLTLLQRDKEEAIREKEDAIREKEKATRQLEEAQRDLGATLCQLNCCPAGWMLFNQKCLWMSWEGKTWEQSKQDCERRSSQLLMLKPWDAGNRRDAEVITSQLQSSEFWIGLKETWNKQWRWVDGSRYEGSEKPDDYGDCVKMSQRTIKREPCDAHLRFVCEKAASSWPAY